MKRLIVFDLDGTLAESKQTLDDEMALLLARLLAVVQVAVISGGDWPQFQTQVLARLHTGTPLTGLSLLPTCGAKFFRFEGAWRRLYSEEFSAAERAQVLQALEVSIRASECAAPKVWGDTIQDRGSQITFSALGQRAPLAEKAAWDPDFARRSRMKALLDADLPGFSVRLGGMTSVDVTRRGIDKGYGIGKLEATLGVPVRDMIYVGDALFAGGNDRPAADAGTRWIQVRGPEETKRVVEAITACLATAESWTEPAVAEPPKGT
jgi:HAD superfamily hydrolase (TIGR01484 family)